MDDLIKLENFFPAYSFPRENIPDIFKNYQDYESDDYYLTNMMKKEFASLKLKKDEPRPPKGQPLKQQDFIRKYMSPVTPYDKMLIFHGLGTGKTCLSVFAYECFKQFFKEDETNEIKKALVIVRGPNSKKNFIRELANYCTSGEYIPSNIQIKDKETGKIRYVKLTQNQRLGRTLKLIRKYYQIETFIKFATELAKMSEERIKKLYSNTYIIIDEVHNLRYQPKESKVNLYSNFHRLLHTVESSKILLLSATPMRDQPDEIVSIANLLLSNDKQFDVKTFKKNYLDEEGFVLENKKDELRELFKGWVSYVRSMESTVKKQLEGKIQKPFMNYIPTFTHKMNSFQEKVYTKCWNEEKTRDSQIDDADDDNEDDDTEEGSAEGLYKKSRQSALFVFPDETFGNEGINSRKWVTIDKKRNLATLTSAMKENLAPNGTVEEKLQALEKYSKKYAYIIKTIIENPKEKIFIYSSYVRGGGALLIGALLQYFGFSHIDTDRLFQSNPLDEGEETFDEKTLEQEADENVIERLEKKSTRFAIITGTNLTPAISDNLINRVYNHSDNTEGQYLRIIIGSHVVGEGLSFKCVRQLHVVTPHWNNSVTEQAIGRGIRAFSHDMLPPEERYIKIYRHASIPEKIEKIENSVDMVMYKLSEDKDVKIKAIERLMKESAVDCYLNKNRNIRTDLDKDGSRACDYQDCDYECVFVDTKKLQEYDKIEDTNNLYYADSNINDIISTLREIFYNHDSVDLEDLMKYIGKYTPFVILRALKKVIDDQLVFETRFGTNCYLRENNNLYFLVNSVEYPNSFLLSGYASLPIIKIDKSLETYIEKKDTLDINDSNDRSRVYYIFRKLFTSAIREIFLEKFYQAKIQNVDKNKELRDEFLQSYGNYIMEVDGYPVSFYLYKSGGKMRVYKDNSWEDASEELVKRFNDMRKDQLENFKKNIYGFFAYMEEDIVEEKLNSICEFKFKLYKNPKEIRYKASGEIDKRVAREYKPGTECGTGSFTRPKLIEMLSEILLIKINENDTIPEVPIYGTGIDKIDVKTAKNLKSAYNNLAQNAKDMLDAYEETYASLNDDKKSFLKNPTSEKSVSFYKGLSKEQQKKMDELLRLTDIKNAFTDIVRTTGAGLCEYSKRILEEKGLLYYI